MKRLLIYFLILASLPLSAQSFLQKLTGDAAGFNGRTIANNFGQSVSVSDEVMVVGAYLQNYNSAGVDSVYLAGAAYVYHKSGNKWVFIKKLTGEFAGKNGRVAEDFFGWSVSVSGDVIVVSAYNQDYDSNGNNYIKNAGAVYIYGRHEGGTDNWGFIKKLTGTSAGVNGSKEGDWFGYSTYIKENVMIVGAYRQDYDSVGVYKAGAGAAYLFYRNKGGVNNWGFVKKITGASIGSNTQLSVCVSKDIAVVGTLTNGEDSSNTNYIRNAGAAYVFYKDAGGKDNWGFVKKLTGASAGNNGRTEDDFFGYSVSVSGDLIVIGAPFNDYDSVGGGMLKGSGAVYIYQKNKGGTDNWGFVKKLTGASAGYRGRAPNSAFGNAVSISEDIITVGSFLYSYDASGSNTLDEAGAAYVFYRNNGGANNWGFAKKLVGEGYNGRKAGDYFGYSVHVHNGVIIVGANHQEYNSIGEKRLSESGAAFVFASYFQRNLQVFACKNYISPSGKTYTMTGIYNDTLTSSLGIDSVITINLTVNQPTFSSITQAVCKSYLSPQGKTYTTTGSYIDTLVNALGCDSIIAIQLTVNQPTFSSISPTACDSYLSPQGNTYTLSGIYVDSLVNSVGCDSIITINLTINKVKNTVTQQGTNLIANDSNASAYQWLDCSNNYAIISGEGNQTFTAVKNGSYAVEIALGSCVDTSDCINITGLTIGDITTQTISIYPNPTKGQVTIIFSQPIERAEVKVLNIAGQVIFEKQDINGNTETLDLATLPSGIYFVEVSDKETTYRSRLVKF